MHKDIYFKDNIKRPDGEIHVVYFSSSTNNTKRFIDKLGFKNSRIPISHEEETIKVDSNYVIICPTYSGGGEFTSNAIPKSVIKFLNVKENRDLCRGVIATGNTNFNDTFALAGPILSKKLNVPLLFQLELSGTKEDVERTKKILKEFWEK